MCKDVALVVEDVWQQIVDAPLNLEEVDAFLEDMKEDYDAKNSKEGKAKNLRWRHFITQETSFQDIQEKTKGRWTWFLVWEGCHHNQARENIGLDGGSKEQGCLQEGQWAIICPMNELCCEDPLYNSWSLNSHVMCLLVQVMPIEIAESTIHFSSLTLSFLIFSQKFDNHMKE